MALFSKDIETLDDLFVHQLRDIYYAEKQIVKALPKMIDKASDADLKMGLRDLCQLPIQIQATKWFIARPVRCY